MKVVVANNYYYLRGGCERVMFNDIQAMSAHGIDIVPFSAADSENVPTPYSSYFVPGADIRATSLLGRVEAAADAIHCGRTAEAFDKMLADTKPDVIHCHNIYGRLSTSILAVAKKRNIPTVLTVHDYKVVCPAYVALKNGKPCSDCIDGGYYRCAINRCHKGQLGASVVYSIEAYWARLTGNYGAVSAFLCPSHFIAGLLRQSGIEEKRVIYHANCVEPDDYVPSYKGQYVLSVGRLSHEKGLPTFLEAMLGTKIPVRIAGTGPMEASLRAMAEKDGGAIVLEGHCGGTRLAELYRNAALVVVPSEWYENAPMSILESFAYGKPVIGTRIGGIPELITEGEHGYLVDPGAKDQLRTAICQLWNDRDAQSNMGRNARRLVETKFAQRSRTASLLNIYESVRGSGSRTAYSADLLAHSRAR
ncbi:MAG TPA: glycosyltransferase family 4 protein [Bryobacteraceae bacterium]|nr:glycosyltransferase family 4 protein [Bryobacteraceae bacterium]